MPFLILFFSMALVMTSAWIVQLRTKRAELVDVCWAIGMGAASIYLATASAGDLYRRILVSSLTSIWSLRLAWHLIRDRVLAHKEDGRYADLRAEWGAHSNRKFFIFFQIQTFLVVVLATGYYAAFQNESPLSITDYSAATLFCVAIVLEAIADEQLKHFKLRSSAGLLCTEGFWRYSRHPNYFFEWMHWMALPLFAWGGSHWWLSFLAPALMYYLIRYVTGVVPAEVRMKISRPTLFAQYKRETSEFFPWFVRKG